MSQDFLTLEVRQKILTLFQDKLTKSLPLDQIEKMTLLELGIDSMNLLQLAFDIEMECKLKINLDKLSATTTVKMFIEALEPMKD